jgi:tetratricopeptide (TPR) repeat protein
MGEQHHRMADYLADLGATLTNLGSYADAEQCARQSLEIAHRTYGPGKKWTLRFARTLAWLLIITNHNAEAATLLSDELEDARRVMGEEDFETLNLVFVYADALSRLGRSAEAAEHTARGFELALRKAGPAYKWTRDFRRSHARCLWDLGRRDEAEALLNENLDACRAAHGARDVETLAELNKCADFLQARGEPAKAEPLAREAVEGYRHVEPKFRRALGNPLDTLATILNQLNRPQEALPLFEEIMQQAEDACKESGIVRVDNLTLAIMRRYADTLEKLDRRDEALSVLQEGVTTASGEMGEDNIEVQNLTLDLGVTLCSSGRSAEAETILRRVLAVRRRTLGEDDDRTLLAKLALAHALSSHGRYDPVEKHPAVSMQAQFDEAEKLLREAVETRRRTLGPADRQTLWTLNQLAWLLYERGNLNEAEQTAHDAVAGYRSIQQEPDAESCDAIDTLATVIRDSGRPDEALTLYEEIQQTYTAGGAKLGPQVPGIRLRHAECLIDLGRCQEAERELLANYDAMMSEPAPDETVRRLSIEAAVRLYEEWHAAEPGQGHDSEAAQWQARLAALGLQ